MYVNNSNERKKTTLSSSLHKLFAVSQYLSLYSIMVFMFSSLPKNESARSSQYTQRKCKFCVKDCAKAKIRLDFHQLITSSASQPKCLFSFYCCCCFLRMCNNTYCIIYIL